MVLYIYVLQKSWIHLEVYKSKLQETGNHNQKHVDLPRKGSYSSIEEGLLVYVICLICYVMLRSTMEPRGAMVLLQTKVVLQCLDL
jgi:hypothetical protein